jgi:diacylglycerol kinase
VQPHFHRHSSANQKIKDIGAAIVLLSLLTSAVVWVLVLWR